MDLGKAIEAVFGPAEAEAYREKSRALTVEAYGRMATLRTLGRPGGWTGRLFINGRLVGAAVYPVRQVMAEWLSAWSV
jgi:hypothetical protein